MVISMRPLHYLKDNKWTEIDLRPKETENGYIVEAPSYKCEVIKFPFEIKVNGQSWKQLDSPNTSKMEVTTDGIEFEPFDNVKFLIYFRPRGVQVYKNGDRELTWKVNGKVVVEPELRVDCFPALRSEELNDIIKDTKSFVRGKVQSKEKLKRDTKSKDKDDEIYFEIIYEHDHIPWLKQVKDVRLRYGRN
jgi:hypothetical protein